MTRIATIEHHNQQQAASAMPSSSAASAAAIRRQQATTLAPAPSTAKQRNLIATSQASLKRLFTSTSQDPHHHLDDGGVSSSSSEPLLVMGYIIAQSWFDEWTKYVCFNQGSPVPIDEEDKDDDEVLISQVGAVQRAPGPIDNAAFFEPDPDSKSNSIRIRSSPIAGNEYTICSKETWDLLHSWYGGGPAAAVELVPHPLFKDRILSIVHPITIWFQDKPRRVSLDWHFLHLKFTLINNSVGYARSQMSPGKLKIGKLLKSINNHNNSAGAESVQPLPNYENTTLLWKIGIQDGDILVFIDAPKEFSETDNQSILNDPPNQRPARTSTSSPSPSPPAESAGGAGNDVPSYSSNSSTLSYSSSTNATALMPYVGPPFSSSVTQVEAEVQQQKTVGPSSSSFSTSYSASASTSTYSSGYTSAFSSSNYSSTYSYPSYNSWSSHNWDKSDSGFVGLSNQGATCYLNSLLQSMFMTPELCLRVYEWQGGKAIPDNRNIPLQLQRLFARLQLSHYRSVSTKDLTDSFGWKGAEAFVQHDVQELMRVLFDALDQTIQKNGNNKDGTSPTPDQQQQQPASALASDLYSGTIIDYIRTVDGKHQRVREDTFMDVQLVIRGISSIEEALATYIKPEEMNGENQWFCEDLGRKVDAIKGLSFKKLPYILTLQLKRFDIDYTTFQRIKLGNRVTFPLGVLDMSPYLPESDVEGRAKARYELFSILIHSGSSTGGHYYAYIKSFDDGKWYKFNDSTVMRITESEVEKMYGEEEDERFSSGGYWHSSTNAYMLMYRQIDRDGANMKNSDVSDSKIPASVYEEVLMENRHVDDERAAWEAQHATAEITLNFEHHQQQRIRVNRSDTVGDLIEIIANQHQVPKEHILLRETRGYYSTDKGPSLVGRESLELRELVDYSAKCKGKLLVTIRDPASEDDNNNSIGNQDDDSTLQLMIVTVDASKPLVSLDNHDYFLISVSKWCTVTDLRKQIANMIPLPVSRLKIIKIRTTSWNDSLNGEIIEDSNQELYEDLYLRSDDKLHAECCVEDNAPESVILNFLQDQANRIAVYFNVPSVENQYTQSVSIDKRKTLRDLKVAISQVISMPNIDEFRFGVHYTMTDGKEIKDLDKTISDSAVGNNSQLYVQLGRARPKHVHSVQFVMEKPTSPPPPEPEGEDIPPALISSSSLESMETDVRSPEATSTAAKHADSVGEAESAFEQATEPNTEPLPTSSTGDSKEDADITANTAEARTSSASPMRVASPAQQDWNNDNGGWNNGSWNNNSGWRSQQSYPLYQAVAEFDVDENMLLSELKEKLAEIVSHPARLIQLSSRFGHFVLKYNWKTIKENIHDIADKETLVIQKLDKSEDFREGDMAIKVQRYYPSRWRLDKETQIVVNTFTENTVGALNRRLAQMYNLEACVIAKPLYSWGMYESSDISLLNWKLDESWPLTAAPLKLEENSIVFFKDATENEKTPISELRKLKAGGYSSRERALKIYLHDEQTNSTLSSSASPPPLPPPVPAPSTDGAAIENMTLSPMNLGPSSSASASTTTSDVPPAESLTTFSATALSTSTDVSMADRFSKPADPLQATDLSSDVEMRDATAQCGQVHTDTSSDPNNVVTKRRRTEDDNIALDMDAGGHGAQSLS